MALVGEPGVGKSRLVWELTHSAPHAAAGLVLESGSVSYGKATSYLPVIDLLKALLPDRDARRRARDPREGDRQAADARRGAASRPCRRCWRCSTCPVEDAAWAALDPPQRRRQTLDAVKRLLLRESQEQPLLLVFEDLHWIDSETQALLDSLVESLPTARILLLVNYRPEYTPRLGQQELLHPAPDRPARRRRAPTSCSAALLGDDPIARAAEGAADRADRGQPVLPGGERPRAGRDRRAGRRARRLPAGRDRSTSIRVPATVQAVLAARIDRLPPEEKRLLQTAAVIGKDVPFALLQAIADRAEDELQARPGAAPGGRAAVRSRACSRSWSTRSSTP